MTSSRPALAPVPRPGAALPPLKASPPLGRKPTNLKPLDPVSPNKDLAAAAAQPAPPAAISSASQPLPPTAKSSSATAPLPPPQASGPVDSAALKQAAQQLLALPLADAEGRKSIIAQHAAANQAAAWQLYRRMRSADLAAASAAAAVAVQDAGVVAPAALALRKSTALVQGQLVAFDLPLLRESFAASGPPANLLDALYEPTISQLAQRTIASAASAHVASKASPTTAAATPEHGGSANGDGGRPRVSWPAVMREANAVCDALCGLVHSVSAGLAAPGSEVGGGGGGGGALVQLERGPALLASEAVLIEATREHVEQLVQGAIRGEAAGAAPGGLQRKHWVKVAAPTGQPSYVLGSCAALVSSLQLQATGAAFGVLPRLDVALCEALSAAVAEYAGHVLAVAGACATVAKGLTASGRTRDGKGVTAAVPPALLAVASDRALPIVCLSSVLALRRLIERMLACERVGTATGTAVPPLRWSDALCQERLGEAAAALGQAEKRLAGALCDGVASVACVAAVDAAHNGELWGKAKAWRSGTRCSLPLQLCLLQLHTAKANLDALGDAALADTLFARIVRRVLGRLVRTYYQEVAPSEPLSATLVRDLHLLAATALGASDLADADAGGAAAGGGVVQAAATAPSAAEVAHSHAAAECASAAAAAGVGPPAVEDASLPVERRRAGQLGLWIVSLLALRSAPLPALCEFMRAAAASGGGGSVGGGGSGGSATSEAASDGSADYLGAVGVDTLPQGSGAAVEIMRALALPSVAPPAHAIWKPLYDTEKKFMQSYVRPAVEGSHPKLQEAAEAPLPEGLDWGRLLSWDAFPLRNLPNVVRHAMRRHPSLQPGALAVAQELAAKDPALASDVECRKELMARLGLPATIA